MGALGVVLLLYPLLAGVAAESNSAEPSAEPDPRLILERDFTAFLDALAAGVPPRRDELGRLFDEHGLDELQQLILKHGVGKTRWAMALFGPGEWGRIVSRRGGDFFLLLLQALLDAKEHIVHLGEVFQLEARRLAASAIEEEGRFTAALSVLSSCVAIADFRALVGVFERKLPPGLLIETFYEDPYLVAHALKVIGGRDPTGQWLERYLDYFPDDGARGALFANDLPGLVVSFATLHEISDGEAVPEVFGYFDLTRPELVRLIGKDALSVAYVLYGAHLLGSGGFHALIEAVGKDTLRKALFLHTKWLASYLMGLQEISYLSTTPDISDMARSLEAIEKRYPYLLRFPGRSDLTITERTEPLVEFMVLPADELLRRPDRVRCVHEVLLGVLALFQGMLDEHAPGAALNERQYRLLKLQILSSTRFSGPFDSASSNFELGERMLRKNSVPMIPLVLAHELAHQMFALHGFDAAGLSGFSIHELSADIGARAVAQLLDRQGVLGEALRLYEERVVSRDDFARHNRIPEDQLIALGNEHIIGRTQLSYIIEGFAAAGEPIDWERMFALAIDLLRRHDSPRFREFVERLVIDYVYLAEAQAPAPGDAEGVTANIPPALRTDAQLIDASRVRTLIGHVRRSAIP